MKRRYAMLAWALPVAALSMGACNSNPAAGLCNDYCGCEECSDSEEDTCEKQADEAFEKAKSEGCEEPFEAYADCLSDGFECNDDRARYTETCAAEQDALTECAGAVIAIGGNVCSLAATICGALGGTEGAQCSGPVVCAAQCIVDANSCDVTDPDLANCITSCTG